jgi:hypothetical protein
MGLKKVDYLLVPDPAHAPTFLVYTGSKPQILHGMGEKGGGQSTQQALVNNQSSGWDGLPINC